MKTTKIMSAALVSVLALGLSTGVANAKMNKAGSECATSGVVKVEKKKKRAQLCTADSSGDLQWTKPWKFSKLKKNSLESSDRWAKAASEGMSAAFGEIENNTNKPITIIAAKSSYAKSVQLHEMVMKDGAMVMGEKKGGFTIQPGETLELAPGGNHLMFIGLKKTIKPGTTVPIWLYTSDGDRVKMKFMGRNFAGANEDYPEGEMDDMPGHGSGDMPHHDSDKMPGNHMEGMSK